MSTDAESLYEAAMRLPEDERVQLAGRLLEGADPGFDPEWEAAWRKEICAVTLSCKADPSKRFRGARRKASSKKRAMAKLNLKFHPSAIQEVNEAVQWLSTEPLARSLGSRQSPTRVVALGTGATAGSTRRIPDSRWLRTF